MRRADRLFQIVQLLRRSRATTAAQLATELQVSERTVYRDVQDLVRSGVPIRGEAGVGYALPARFELPPLMFTAVELQALALGARMVQGWADADLARAARSATSRIENVLPEALAETLAQSRLFVPDFHNDGQAQAQLGVLRAALDARAVLQLSYRDERGAVSQRAVRPLGLFYWGKTWTLVGWCELRRDFRSFRLDRIDTAEQLPRTFADESGRRLEDFLARVQCEDPVPKKTASRPVESARRKQPPGSGS
ncbi:MAG: YafY family transcriptional regulator [Planctomycetes bacterium]|nr:YafY family transcriptional regulator [Planctomycetota bacterium]